MEARAEESLVTRFKTVSLGRPRSNSSTPPRTEFEGKPIPTPPWPAMLTPYLPVTTSSMRRLRARPSSVSLDAIGRSCPYPLVEIRSAEIP